MDGESFSLSLTWIVKYEEPGSSWAGVGGTDVTGPVVGSVDWARLRLLYLGAPKFTQSPNQLVEVPE